MAPGRKTRSANKAPTKASLKAAAKAAAAAAAAEAAAAAAAEEARNDSPSPPPPMMTSSMMHEDVLPKSPPMTKSSMPPHPITPLKMSMGPLPIAPGTPGTPGTPGPFPVPQTPLGSAPPMMMPAPNASAFETDLPPELLNQGWRKFWSRRENRPYFFNRVSGDTMWEMPPIFNSHPTHNPLSDPLGINQNGPGSLNGPPHHMLHHQHQQTPPQHHNPHLMIHHQPQMQTPGQVRSANRIVTVKRTRYWAGALAQ